MKARPGDEGLERGRPATRKNLKEGARSLAESGNWSAVAMSHWATIFFNDAQVIKLQREGGVIRTGALGQTGPKGRERECSGKLHGGSGGLGADVEGPGRQEAVTIGAEGQELGFQKGQPWG